MMVEVSCPLEGRNPCDEIGHSKGVSPWLRYSDDALPPLRVCHSDRSFLALGAFHVPATIRLAEEQNAVAERRSLQVDA